MENPWNTYGKMMVLVLNPLAAIGIPCVFDVVLQISHMLPVS